MQDAPNHVVLVPSRGTTPFAAAVQAQVQYVAAYGDMRESLSMARKINAQAVAQEIKNSVDYIDAYFKGRAINKEARAKENPNYLARQEHLYDVRKRMIEKHLDQGSKVETLNWLLGELSVPVLSNQYMVGRGAQRVALEPQAVGGRPESTDAHGRGRARDFGGRGKIAGGALAAGAA